MAPGKSSQKILAIAMAVGIMAGSFVILVEYDSLSTQSTSTLPTTESFSIPSLSTTSELPSSSQTTSTVQTQIITVNGSQYYADDVSTDVSVGNPGYSFFHNASVTFLGVKFVTYCPPSFSGCPIPTGTTVTTATTMFLGAIRLNATFTDNSTETIGGVIGDISNFFVFSHHINPQAGILIIYSGASTSADKVYLLVSEVSALQLQLSVGNSGGAVSITADDFNTLSHRDNISASYRWVISLTGHGPPCWRDDWPVGFAIASGHYTSANITAAKLLDLVNPSVTYSCPPYLGAFGAATGFSFQPLSDTALGYGCPVNFCPTEPVSTALDQSTWGAVTGYWSHGGTFTTFPKGTYTVLAEDEWGQSSIAFFTIS